MKGGEGSISLGIFYKRGVTMQPTHGVQAIVPPDPSYESSWYVWWVLIIGLLLMTFIGTWLVTGGGRMNPDNF